MEFDETKAIEYMREAIGRRAEAYDDDQLLNLIDIIWDFYEENGLLDIDADEEIDDEEAVLDDLVAYARRMLRKDKESKINDDDIAPLIEAEIDYENSIDQ